MCSVADQLWDELSPEERAKVDGGAIAVKSAKELSVLRPERRIIGFTNHGPLSTNSPK